MATKMKHVMRHDDEDDMYELVDDAYLHELGDDEDFEPLAHHHSPSTTVLDGQELDERHPSGANPRGQPQPPRFAARRIG